MNLLEVFQVGLVDTRPIFFTAFSSPVCYKSLVLDTALCVISTIVSCYSSANGLYHLWSHGVVHRDVKPGNILLSVGPDGR